MPIKPSVRLGVIGTYPDREAIAILDTPNHGFSQINSSTSVPQLLPSHVLGQFSLGFQKFDGAEDFAGVEAVIPSVNCARFTGRCILETCVWLEMDPPANLEYVFIRLGTDAVNYNEWRFPEADITMDVVNFLSVAIHNIQTPVAGNGWRQDDIRYVALGVVVKDEAHAVDLVAFDHIVISQPMS